jgi:hypothetical protein
MAKEYFWNIRVDGTRHEIVARDKGNGFDIFVDDAFRFTVRSDINLDIEEDLTVGSKRCRIVVYRGVPDLAVDGILLDAEAQLVKEERRNRLYTLLGGVFLLVLGFVAMGSWIFLKASGTWYFGGAFGPLFAVLVFVAGIWLVSRAFRKCAY